MRDWLLVAVVCVAGTGCMVSAEFTPYSSTSTRPALLTSAVRAYEGDIPTLLHAGAELVGTVETDGHYLRRDTVDHAIAAEGARHGGTHYIVLRKNSDPPQDQPAATSFAKPTQTAPTALATYYPSSTLGTRFYEDAIVVLRIPWENLRLVPRELWPKKGVHYAKPVHDKTKRRVHPQSTAMFAFP